MLPLRVKLSEFISVHDLVHSKLERLSYRVDERICDTFSRFEQYRKVTDILCDSIHKGKTISNES